MAMPAPFEGLHKETAKMDRRRVIAFAWKTILDLKSLFCVSTMWRRYKFIASEDHACLVVLVEKSDHRGLWARNL